MEEKERVTDIGDGGREQEGQGGGGGVNVPRGLGISIL